MKKRKDKLLRKDTLLKKGALLKTLELEMWLRDFSEKTSEMYIFYNEKFLEYVNKDPKKVTESDINGFIVYKMDQDSLSNSSVRLIRSSLRFCYNDVMNRNFLMIETPKISKKLPITLTKNEVRRILDNTERPKHRLLVELLYSTGLKLSECINLRYSDLDMKKSVGLVRNRDSSKNRIFILSKMLKKDLLKYGKTHIEDEYIFSVNGRKMSPRGIQSAIKVAAGRSGINKDVSPRILRHSFAKRMLDNGTDIGEVQGLMGCTNIQVMRTQAHMPGDDIRRLKSPLDMS